jgi:hypothetical protein
METIFHLSIHNVPNKYRNFVKNQKTNKQTNKETNKQEQTIERFLTIDFLITCLNIYVLILDKIWTPLISSINKLYIDIKISINRFIKIIAKYQLERKVQKNRNPEKHNL